MRRLSMMLALCLALMVVPHFAVGADSMDMMRMPMPVGQTHVAGPYRITLFLLPAEPFVTRKTYLKTHPADGMLVIRGATPVQPGGSAHPNHHLVAHLYRADGSAVQGAHVSMSVHSTSAAGSAPPVIPVPVVEMQVVGKGSQSTHYGNNLALPPGSYKVTISVDATAATTFSIAAP